MNLWSLPRTAKIGGKVYGINADFRDVLEILGYLNDQSRPDHLRWRIAVGLFFDGDIPPENMAEAMDFLSDFISYESRDEKPGPKLLDWEQDAHMIIGDVNKVAGTEIRALPFVHWWTFLSYFYGIGEGQLSTVVSIRSKKRKGKKLDDWEREFYKENKSRVDFRKQETPEDKALKENISKWL